MVSAPARREQVRYMVGKGLSERRALAVVRMSASAFRYTPRPDRNVELRERIVALAQRQPADITVGALVSGGLTLLLMVLMFVFTTFVLRLVVDHFWWAVLAFVAALAVTVLVGLPFDDMVLGDVPALIPLIVGLAMIVAGALWAVLLKKSGRSLADPLVNPMSSR